MTSPGNPTNPNANTNAASPQAGRASECAVYHGIQLFQDEDGLWCWYDPVFGVRSDGELWSQDSAKRDIDHYRVQRFRAH